MLEQTFSQLGNAKHIIDKPGEFDIGECSIVGLAIKQSDDTYSVIFWLEVGGIKLAYLGNTNQWAADAEGLRPGPLLFVRH